MFNWYGNHKIGILGTSNCGKTVLLTSLLWHLESHDPKKFDCGGLITDCEIIENKKKPFNYEKNKNYFRGNKWPAKTTDYSKITCKYAREDCKFKRKVTFVDIPGERMADVFIWQCQSYVEWSDKILKFWDADPDLNKYVNEYLQKLNNLNPLSENEAIKLYKDLLKNILLNLYCPITPSTYFLSSKGRLLQWEDFSSEKYYDIPIWDEGEFFPLPKELMTKNNKNIFIKLSQRYNNYRKKVIKPLFSEIHDCDNFIVCIDIFDILNAGKRALYHCENEIKTFFEKIKPSKFMSLYNKIGRNPPRIAFVATKADLAAGKNINNLESLLSDVIYRCKSKYIKSEQFTCAAFVSTEIRGDMTIGQYEQDKAQIPDLPPEWPKNWEEGRYGFFTIAPTNYCGKAPDQVNLNKIFNFVTEDIK